jgi:hypothetical protein
MPEARDGLIIGVDIGALMWPRAWSTRTGKIAAHVCMPCCLMAPLRYAARPFLQSWNQTESGWTVSAPQNYGIHW